MSQPKKARKDQQANGIDVLLGKLVALPPAVDLVVAGALGGYAFIAVYLDGARFIALVCLLLGLLFAMLGLSALHREMGALKLVTRGSQAEALRNMNVREFERYLRALFSLDGYAITAARDELSSQDDADLILTRKKERVLVQFNHWDEDAVGLSELRSLQRAGAAIRATGCVAVTLGEFSQEVAAAAHRKGVTLMTLADLVETSQRLVGAEAVPAAAPSPPDVALEQAHDLDELVQGRHRFLIVDFAGLVQGISRLKDLLAEQPAYAVLASTLPADGDLASVRDRLGELGNRLVGQIEVGEHGRYFDIHRFLRTTPAGRGAVWIAVDSEPRHYPEGCSELVAVNPSFGFDASAAQRLVEAMVLAEQAAQQRAVRG